MSYKLSETVRFVSSVVSLMAGAYAFFFHIPILAVFAIMLGILALFG